MPGLFPFSIHLVQANSRTGFTSTSEEVLELQPMFPSQMRDGLMHWQFLLDIDIARSFPIDGDVCSCPPFLEISFGITSREKTTSPSMILKLGLLQNRFTFQGAVEIASSCFSFIKKKKKLMHILTRSMLSFPPDRNHPPNFISIP